MVKSPSPLLRRALAVLLLSPSFSAVQAAAQVVGDASVSGASAASSFGAAGAAAKAPLALGAAPLLSPSMSANLAPALNSAPAPVAFAAPLPAASVSAAPAEASASPSFADAAPAAASEPAAPESAPAVSNGARVVPRFFAALSGLLRADSKSSETPAAAETRADLLFDGGKRGRDVEGAAPVAAALPALAAASLLEKPSPRATVPASAPAAPPAASFQRRVKAPLAATALIVAGLLLATPGMALAATAAAPLAASAASLSLLASIHPTVTAAGALAGAIYGMFASRSKDGTPSSTADVFSSIMRYGVLGGAGTYVLLNATQAAFGAAIGLQPLSSAIAIAALGRTAFQEKFMYATTSSADRVYGAFPAVAAAVGISVAVGMTAAALAVPTLAVTLATGTMAATGVATALFAALFQPGRSPLAGPPNMAKGYVLQALMMGLALSMTNPWLFWPFAAMGAAGFGLVMWTSALEIWAHRPGAPAQPLPPAPPVTPPPAPPAPPTSPALSPAAQALRKTAAEIGFPAFTASDYKPGPTKHIVLFRYKDSVTPAQKEEVKRRFLALQQLSQRLGQPYIESIETGPQTSGEGVDQGLEQGFIVTFRSEGDRNFYVGQPVVTDPNFYDPAHQAFKDFVGPLLHDPVNPSGVAVFDLATGN